MIKLYQNGYLKKSRDLLKSMYSPKTLEQIAREIIKLYDKEIDKEMAKKMNNPNYFIDGIF